MTSQRLAVRASSAAAAWPRHRDHAPRCRSASRRSARHRHSSRSCRSSSWFTFISANVSLMARSSASTSARRVNREGCKPTPRPRRGRSRQRSEWKAWPFAPRRTRSARAEDVGAVIFAASPFGSKSTRQARHRPPREAPATMRRKSYRIVSAGAEQRRRRRSVAMRLRRQWRASAKLEVCDPSPLAGEGGVAKQRRMRGLARERRLAARPCAIFSS